MNVDDLVMLNDVAERMEVKPSALRAFLKKNPVIAPPKRLGRLCFTPDEMEIVRAAWQRAQDGCCIHCGWHPEMGLKPPFETDE